MTPREHLHYPVSGQCWCGKRHALAEVEALNSGEAIDTSGALVSSFSIYRFDDDQPDLIRKNSMELSPAETYQVIVCSKCYKDVRPMSMDEFKALELTVEEVENGRNFRCPRCGDIVYWVSDEGALEFGI